ncbi:MULTISPECIES: ParA family protein [unclassified Chryseobacterium]|uniref:ParA family protein n=1 Tax=unclassified Chryseobacterium TaxID=2593645 RepID=UPI00301948AD
MAKIISLFNHKGGVSKTTTVFHLGWKLASLGKKVLMIDADPQCNLTGLTLGLDDYDSLLKFYENKNNTDIFSSLAPIFEFSNIEAKENPHAITATKNPNLFILAGNIRFSELDIQIATALTSSGTIPILRKFVGAFNNFVRKIAEENDIDIVVVDMSPSVSSTNHCIFMSSDYFIIPVSPDFYCYQAIDSLSNVLPKWAEDIEKFKGDGEDSIPNANPKMLGFISQNYRIYTVGRTSVTNEDELTPKRMSKVYQDWLEKINDILNNKLVPELRKKDMIIDESIFKESVTYGEAYHLSGVQNFSGLIPVSQATAKPIFELNKSDGNWTGARWKWKKNGKEYGIKNNIEEADMVYGNLAEAVIKMI